MSNSCVTAEVALTKAMALAKQRITDIIQDAENCMVEAKETARRSVEAYLKAKEQLKIALEEEQQKLNKLSSINIFSSDIDEILNAAVEKGFNYQEIELAEEAVKKAKEAVEIAKSDVKNRKEFCDYLILNITNKAKELKIWQKQKELFDSKDFKNILNLIEFMRRNFRIDFVKCLLRENILGMLNIQEYIPELRKYQFTVNYDLPYHEREHERDLENMLQRTFFYNQKDNLYTIYILDTYVDGGYVPDVFYYYHNKYSDFIDIQHED